MKASAWREMVIGASLSLSGQFRHQGTQAANGLRLWIDYVKSEGGLSAGLVGSRYSPRVLILDDGSHASRAKANVERLLTQDRVDLLVGPYSSGLTLAVAPLAEAGGKILWNHGGASDAIVERGWHRLVSLPSPASQYFRALPRWVKQKDPTASRVSILYARTGTFAGHVARGAAEAASAAGFDVVRSTAFESPIRNAEGALRTALEPEPDLLIGVGRFDDDIALVRCRDRFPAVRHLAVVGAGLTLFSGGLGDLVEGVTGPTQWEPAVPETPTLGPGSAWFCSAFERVFREPPEYPAAQAFALGLVLGECLGRAGSLEDAALLEAARALERTTLYGRFRLDPRTGQQIGHEVCLVQWQGGRKVLIRAPSGRGAPE